MYLRTLTWPCDSRFVDSAITSNYNSQTQIYFFHQLKGYIIRWANYTECGFKEGVSLTVDDELNRWQKYSYGMPKAKLIFIRFLIVFLYSRLQRTHLSSPHPMVAQRTHHQTTPCLPLVRRARTLQNQYDVLHVFILRYRCLCSTFGSQLSSTWSRT